MRCALAALLVVLVLPLARPLAAAPRVASARRARAPLCHVVANSWMEAQRKRKEEERKRYEEIAERAEQQKKGTLRTHARRHRTRASKRLPTPTRARPFFLPLRCAPPVSSLGVQKRRQPQTR